MGLLRDLLMGRPNGIRSKLRALLGQKPASGTGAADGASQPVVEPAEHSLRLKVEPPRGVTPPEGFDVVLHRDALEAGKIVEVIVAGTAVAVANVDGTFYAISNACAHAEGPLGEGSLKGDVVTCPYHGWQYSVKDGSCLTNPTAKVKTYPIQIVGDAVCVKL